MVGETTIFVQLPDREIKDQKKGSKITKVNEEGTALMQVDHQFLNVGESIAQIKNSTSAFATEQGTIKVIQFRQEVSSRGEEVWYYKNSTGTFEGSLAEAQIAFPDVDFEGMIEPETQYINDPELGRVPIFPNTQPVQWETQNEFDAEKEGGPTTWEKWADATQTALDVVGLIPGLGEIADGVNGVISLARGNYADAALSFAAMIPFAGSAATAIKLGKKLKKAADKAEDTKGVYDLIVRNGDDVKGYVGQSKNIFKRFKQHFNPKRGTLKDQVLEDFPITHIMKGSTKVEREIYEQLIILRKYGGQINPSKNSLAELLNKVNPVGGRFDLKSPEGLKEFYKKAEEIAEKYSLPKNFD